MILLNPKTCRKYPDESPADHAQTIEFFENRAFKKIKLNWHQKLSIMISWFLRESGSSPPLMTPRCTGPMIRGGQLSQLEFSEISSFTRIMYWYTWQLMLGLAPIWLGSRSGEAQDR